MDAARSTFVTERLPGLALYDTLLDAIDSDQACLIVDLAQDSGLSEQLYQDQTHAGWRAESLYAGTAYTSLAPVGPLLTVFAPDAPQCAALIARMEHEPLAIAAVLRADATWSDLATHARSLNRAFGPDGTPTLCRWFDPRWLRGLLNVLTPAERQRFAGPVAAFAWWGAEGWYRWAAPPAPTFVEHQSPWLNLDAARQAMLLQERRMDTAIQFAGDYASHLPEGFDGVRQAYVALKAADEHGYGDLADQERWMRLRVANADGFWRTPPAVAVLARDDLSRAERLELLEAELSPSSHSAQGSYP
jgi:hypothetical protein